MLKIFFILIFCQCLCCNDYKSYKDVNSFLDSFIELNEEEVIKVLGKENYYTPTGKNIWDVHDKQYHCVRWINTYERHTSDVAKTIYSLQFPDGITPLVSYTRIDFYVDDYIVKSWIAYK